MTVLIVFAFFSGIITILSPCILPVLPIVLSGSIGGGRGRPFGVIIGFIAGFTFFTLALSVLVQALGIPADALRFASVVMIVLFGLVLLVPSLRNRFELLASRAAGLGRTAPQAAGTSPGNAERFRGLLSGIPVGLSLGIVWTPCVGPIMASVISLAVTRQADGGTVLITLAYTLGTSIPMLAIMAGGRALLSRVPALVRNTGKIQRGFGVLMIVVGISIAFGWDRRFQAAVLAAFPSYGAGLTALEDSDRIRDALDERSGTGGSQAGAVTAAGPDTVFTGSGSIRPKPGVTADYGRAPEFVTDGPWFNTGDTPLLTLESLRGKVVLLDFWTYSCVNCVRTIPYLRSWYEAYRDEGLVIIGIHTPEFEFEKRPDNVLNAMRDLGVTWPVVLDNGYLQWKAYGNRYWPAHYFIDAEGRVRYFQFGEGHYEESERVIRTLLREAGARPDTKIVSKPEERIQAETPETYLGYRRTKGFLSSPVIRDAPGSYEAGKKPENGEWSLSGLWTVKGQYIIPESSGRLELGFDARNVFLVIEPEEPGGRIEVRVDGKPSEDTADVRDGLLVPVESRMYQLAGLKKRGAHTLSLTVQGRMRLFAFTFG